MGGSAVLHIPQWYLHTPQGPVGGLNAANCQTRAKIWVIFGASWFRGRWVATKQEQEAVKWRVLMAQQIMFAGAELNFQPPGDDGGALEASLIEV